MTMNSDDDYMSEDILKECIANEKKTNKDISKKRLKPQHNLIPKKNKTLKELESERRTEGLATEIAQSNKGFQLLKKMGYEPGKGIGKSLADSVASAPIPLEVKNDNYGLGHKSSRVKVTNAKAKSGKANISDEAIKDYRSSIKRKMDVRTLEYDYCTIRKVCKELDQRANVEEPSESWFWIDDDADEDVISDEEKEHRFLTVAAYLRSQYIYCVWCRSCFENENEMENECPGDERQLHEDEC